MCVLSSGRRLLIWSLALAAIGGWASLAAATSFRWHGASGAGRPPAHRSDGATFSFVAFGDIEEEITGFADVVGEVERVSDPDLGVVLGDIAKRTERAPESYAEFSRTVHGAGLRYPILTVPGNHDRPAPGAPDQYARVFGDLDWWFVHEGCLFVGLDNSSGSVTRHGVSTLRQARDEAAAARRVFVFLHVPVWRPAEQRGRTLSRIESGALHDIDTVRRELGVPVDAVFAAHADEWWSGKDAAGTLHVVAGAEPGLGWPDGTTPQIAAVCTVEPAGLAVRQVRTPYRRHATLAARQVGDVYVHAWLRNALAPVPVWLFSVLATAGWSALTLARRRRGTVARDGI